MKRFIADRYCGICLHVPDFTRRCKGSRECHRGGPQHTPSQASQPSMTPPPKPFNKLNLFASGPVTTGSDLTPCAGLNCQLRIVFLLFVLRFTHQGGLAGATLSGDLLFESTYLLGASSFGCYITHGVATTTAHNFTHRHFGFSRTIVSSGRPLVPNQLQFIANYAVLGGTGSYATAGYRFVHFEIFRTSSGRRPAVTINGVRQK